MLSQSTIVFLSMGLLFLFSFAYLILLKFCFGQIQAMLKRLSNSVWSPLEQDQNVNFMERKKRRACTQSCIFWFVFLSPFLFLSFMMFLFVLLLLLMFFFFLALFSLVLLLSLSFVVLFLVA